MKCVMYCINTGDYVKFGTCKPFGVMFNKDWISYLILQIDLEYNCEYYISKDVIKRRLGKYADS